MKIYKLLKLPAAREEELRHFIEEEIPSTKFFRPESKLFRPESKQDKGYKVFYGDTWYDAYQAASHAAQIAAISQIKPIRTTTDMMTNSPWDSSHRAAEKAISDAMESRGMYPAQFLASGPTHSATVHAVFKTEHILKGIDKKFLPPIASIIAAYDAALLSIYNVFAPDLKFEDKEAHHTHLKARWEIWRQGYGVMNDINGVLYVYGINNPEIYYASKKKRFGLF